MPLQHWMSFATFVEQTFFTYPSPHTYHGVIINGNMAAHAPDGMAAFLLEKNQEKVPYIIDPLTHAFQHKTEFIMSKKSDGTEEVKSSIKVLAEAYGEVVNGIVGTRPLLPKDFSEATQQEDYVRNCLSFQSDHLSKRMVDHAVNKYLEHTEEELKPYCLVAPYFYLTESSFEHWLPLNIAFLKHAMTLREEFKNKIFASVVINKGVLLQDDLINRLVNNFKEIAPDGFLLWVDDLDEHDSNKSELIGLKKIAAALRGISNEVINIHGGYYSLLISSPSANVATFTGVAHGPEFGESRPVVPVGGGIPVAKFYLKALHSRIKYGEIVTYLNKKEWLTNADVFYSKVCNCDACQAEIGNDISNFTKYGESNSKLVKRGRGLIPSNMQYPTSDTKIRCLKHYLQMKQVEYHFINTSNQETIMQDLESGITEFETVIGVDGIGYLSNWLTSLKS